MNIANPSESPVITNDHLIGVLSKPLGSSTERGTMTHRLKIRAAPLVRHFVADFQRGESGAIRSDTEMELLAFTLPVLSKESMEPQPPSTGPLPGESVPETV